MFCVINVNSGTMRSSRARAKWPGFGFTAETRSRRHAYHSQTSFGLRRNASGVANCSGEYFAQRPVRASRKVGTPLSAEIPAPVRTAIRFADRRRSINSAEIEDFTEANE